MSLTTYSSLFSFENKRIKFQNKLFNCISQKAGRKWTTLEVFDDKNKLYYIRIKFGSEHTVEILGPAEKFDLNIQRHIRDKIDSKRNEQAFKRKSSWYELNPQPGKIAVVRFTGGYTRDIEIGRVTELGFYAKGQFGGDGRYYNQSYVADVKDPVEKSNQGD